MLDLFAIVVGESGKIHWRFSCDFRGKMPINSFVEVFRKTR